jgi:hypothetical protein
MRKGEGGQNIGSGARHRTAFVPSTYDLKVTVSRKLGRCRLLNRDLTTTVWCATTEPLHLPTYTNTPERRTNLWTVDAVLEGRLVQQVEQPLDRRREVGRHFEDRPEEVVDKLLERPLGGEEAGEEDLRDGLVGAGSCSSRTISSVALFMSHYSIEQSTLLASVTGSGLLRWAVLDPTKLNTKYFVPSEHMFKFYLKYYSQNIRSK